MVGELSWGLHTWCLHRRGCPRREQEDAAELAEISRQRNQEVLCGPCQQHCAMLLDPSEQGESFRLEAIPAPQLVEGGPEEGPDLFPTLAAQSVGRTRGNRPRPAPWFAAKSNMKCSSGVNFCGYLIRNQIVSQFFIDLVQYDFWRVLAFRSPRRLACQGSVLSCCPRARLAMSTPPTTPNWRDRLTGGAGSGIWGWNVHAAPGFREMSRYIPLTRAFAEQRLDHLVNVAVGGEMVNQDLTEE